MPSRRSTEFIRRLASLGRAVMEGLSGEGLSKLFKQENNGEESMLGRKKYMLKSTS